MSGEAADSGVSLDSDILGATNLDSTYSKLYSNSFAFRKEFTGEPVPRLAKDCSDLLLQGSNNSGIHLTTEKFSTIEEVGESALKYSGKTSENDVLPSRKPDMSAIDIFVKRKKQDLDNVVEAAHQLEKINTIKNLSESEVYTYLENDKLATLRYQDDSVYDKELVDDKSDATDVGARVYMSHNCSVDNVFGLNFGVLADNEKTGPSIITYAAHNRVVGNEDVRLVSRVGEAYVNLDEEGNIKLEAAKGGAYISIRPDGSIAIVPGPDGLLYLGGEPEDALNAALVQTGIPTGGTVTGAPITSTMGGVVGIDPQNATGPAGKFASKVMFR